MMMKKTKKKRRITMEVAGIKTVESTEMVMEDQRAVFSSMKRKKRKRKMMRTVE